MCYVVLSERSFRRRILDIDQRALRWFDRF